MKRKTPTLKQAIKDLMVGIYSAVFVEEVDWSIAILVVSMILAVLAGVGIGVGFFKLIT